MKVTLLHHTPIDVIALAAATPYQSKASNKLVERVWDTGHKSIARHSVAVFLLEDVSQSFLRQVSRHPHINLTVKSSRYCQMDNEYITPKWLPSELEQEYEDDMTAIMEIYSKWMDKEELDKKKKENNEAAKMFLPLASTTDIVLSGNYQALYEMLQLRNCTRTEQEYRSVAREMTKALKAAVPEIFDGLGCRGDELGYCPERFGSCGKHPLKGEV